MMATAPFALALAICVGGNEHDRRRIGPEPQHDSPEPFAPGRAGAFAAEPYSGFLDQFVITRRTLAEPIFWETCGGQS